MNKTLPIFTALFTASAFAQAAPQTLDVYTYDSFSADWSAGPKVKACQSCKLLNVICVTELFIIPYFIVIKYVLYDNKSF